MQASANILLLALDDDPVELEILEVILREQGVTNYHLHTEEVGFFNDMTADINLIIMDHRLGLKNGLEMTKRVKAINPDNYVIITSGIRDFDVAVEYLNAGADKFLKRNEPDYRDNLIEYLIMGFDTAQKRIDRNIAIKILEQSTLKSMNEIAEMAKKLNKSE